MNVHFDCIKCFVNQTCNMARDFLDDREKQYFLIKRVLGELSKIEENSTAPLMAQKIHRIFRESIGDNDPYKNVKELFNREMLAIEEKLQNMVESEDDQIAAALKLAAAGNIIDFGARSNLSLNEVFRTITNTMSKNFSEGVFNRLKGDLSRAGTLLYLGDNAGEIVFDKVFIKIIRRHFERLRIYFATRGKPVINDITEHDAFEVGMDEHAIVINNGTDVPGTVLSACSSDFIKIFNGADLIISKGQGNFESLVDEHRQVYFVFLCKCHLFEEKLGVKKHDIVLYHQ